jgi:hypothetical protein
MLPPYHRRLLALVALFIASPGYAADLTPLAREVPPLLSTHCVRCHGPERQKAGVNLAGVLDANGIVKQPRLWQRVLRQLETREMPPDGDKQPSDEERRKMIDSIKAVLASAEAVRDPGPTVIRRLNRTEYSRTLRDLLGIDFDAAGAVGIPSEPAGTSFDNLAAALDLPPVLLEKYFAAAEQSLERLYAGAAKNPKDPARHAYEAVIGALPGNDRSEAEAAREAIEKFAGRAYRRPVSTTELERLLAVFNRARSKGETYENAVRVVLKTVLVSPHFLFRIEAPKDAKNEGPQRIEDRALAVRLSYMLWSSMPDSELVAAAEQGQLADPAALEKQVRRMLAHPKARALTDNFAGQWLQLRHLAAARPSTDFFPTFTNKLRQAMHDEATTFFDKLREEDRSVGELLDADYTYVNEELAKHYGLSGVQGPQMRRVALKPEDHRGGLLGMAAVLTMTSHTSRTSPTLRGKYILDVILGDPPPPPPPDAGTIDEKQKGKEPKTFRELLAQHAGRAACAACHSKIDPLGFGLENFDAIGRFRETAGDKKIDASGTLPGGQRFVGPDQLKKVVLQRKRDFLRCLTEHLLTYALGRELQYYDERTVREIVARLEREERFSTLVLGVVQSFPFQYRRGNGPAAD